MTEFSTCPDCGGPIEKDPEGSFLPMYDCKKCRRRWLSSELIKRRRQQVEAEVLARLSTLTPQVGR